MTTESLSGIAALAERPTTSTSIPAKLCNHDRLIRTMVDRQLDGIVAFLRPNVFYLSGYASRALQSVQETNGYGVVLLSRSEPEHPVLVLPDWDLVYFIDNPTWIEDIRAYATLQLPFGYPADGPAFDRFVPRSVQATPWGARARETYSDNLFEATTRAMSDLGLTRGRVGFDDLRFANAVTAGTDAEVVDAYGAMKFVRQVKTPVEIDLLRAAARINEFAILNTIRNWELGMSWGDLERHYNRLTTEAGGFVHDPGGIVVGNGVDDDLAFYMVGRSEDPPVRPGTSMIFDCHGTLNHYCWDGGKTWVIGDERTGTAKRIERAAIEALKVIEEGLVPGARLSELQERGRRVFRDMNIPDPDRSLVFFHSLGLEHVDLEIPSLGRYDVVLEQDMITSIHVVYPGGPEDRFYLEDNAVVGPDGGRSLYSWGVDPFRGPSAD